MPSQRPERVARQILQEISKIAGEDIGDPRLAMVTFTEVKITPDLRQARVFFSVLGDDGALADASAALEKARGYIRRELGHRMSLRHVPELRFAVDDTIRVADRIGQLLGGSTAPRDPQDPPQSDDEE